MRWLGALAVLPILLLSGCFGECYAPSGVMWDDRALFDQMDAEPMTPGIGVPLHMPDDPRLDGAKVTTLWFEHHGLPAVRIDQAGDLTVMTRGPLDEEGLHRAATLMLQNATTLEPDAIQAAADAFIASGQVTGEATRGDGQRFDTLLYWYDLGDVLRLSELFNETGRDTREAPWSWTLTYPEKTVMVEDAPLTVGSDGRAIWDRSFSPAMEEDEVRQEAAKRLAAAGYDVDAGAMRVITPRC